MVFYRKYRPQTIDDLDNAKVRETLFSVLKTPTTHAFLFTGPKGLGKTSTARIVAKAINCTGRGEALEPCNQCDQCVSITDGTNLDVLEIDAASNRGIDEIRDLKEKIRLAPFSAKKKVYIIDEVHMLTTEAFNALLKTLEEPPSHAMFILCTTEQHKLPATIISRCMHMQFTPATDEELIRSFRRIVVGEKIDITDEVLHYIARLADRGFRDGAKILEEVVLLAKGEKITRELMEEKYHVTLSADSAGYLLGYLKEKNTKSALMLVKELVDKGVDMKDFISRVLLLLDELLLFKCGVTTNLGKGESIFTLETDEIVQLYKLFSRAYQEMKYAVLPQLPLELAIIEYITTKNVIPSGAKVESRNLSQQSTIDAKDPSTSLGMTKNKTTVSSLRKQVGDIKKNHALYGEPKKEKQEKPAPESSTVELMHAPQGELTQEWLDHFWKNIIVEMKQYNHTIAGVLRSCNIGTYDQKRLLIQTKYPFHKERLDEKKTQEALAKVCKLLTGKEIQVKIELKQ